MLTISPSRSHAPVATQPEASAAQAAASGNEPPRAAVSFFDRDLSQLRFQQRVLEEARDQATPLLERVKFLSIFGTNLDDFIATRGAAVCANASKRLVVEAIARRHFRLSHRLWSKRLEPALARRGLHFVAYADLRADERPEVDEHFRRVVRAAIRPLEVEAATGAVVPSLGLNVAVEIEAPPGRTRLVVVHIPESISPLVPFHVSDVRSRPGLDANASRGYVWLEDVLESHLKDLFQGQTVVSAHRFRVIRQVVSPIDSGPIADPLAHAAATMRARESNPIVALILDERMSEAMRDRLTRALQAPPGSIHGAAAVTNPSRYWEVARIVRPDLHFEAVHSDRPATLEPGLDLFAEIRRGDVLLHHPFDPFDPVIGLIRQAAEDPDVQGIAITLYRMDRESLVAHALLEALHRGKQVHIVVELHARLDEVRNIRWAEEFSRAGATVSYGHPLVKVHAKTALITRHEGTRVRRYAHVSSGNYHAFNARSYTDLALLTCNDDVAADIERLFARLAGHDGHSDFRTIQVGPLSLRSTLERLIDRETEWATRGRDARIILKTNALLDEAIVRRLYAASRAGVAVDLIVRGMCALRPGVRGLSERITVRSVVGRFLEHSRAWYFRNGGDEQAYIGSADVRPRNLDRRIEVMVPLADRDAVIRLRHEILGLYLADNVKARILGADGVYRRATRAPGEAQISAQEVLLRDDAAGQDGRCAPEPRPARVGWSGRPERVSGPSHPYEGAAMPAGAVCAR